MGADGMSYRTANWSPGGDPCNPYQDFEGDDWTGWLKGDARDVLVTCEAGVVTTGTNFNLGTPQFHGLPLVGQSCPEASGPTYTVSSCSEANNIWADRRVLMRCP